MLMRREDKSFEKGNKREELDEDEDYDDGK